MNCHRTILPTSSLIFTILLFSFNSYGGNSQILDPVKLSDTNYDWEYDIMPNITRDVIHNDFYNLNIVYLL